MLAEVLILKSFRTAPLFVSSQYVDAALQYVQSSAATHHVVGRGIGVLVLWLTAGAGQTAERGERVRGSPALSSPKIV